MTASYWDLLVYQIESILGAPMGGPVFHLIIAAVLGVALLGIVFYQLGLESWQQEEPSAPPTKPARRRRGKLHKN